MTPVLANELLLVHPLPTQGTRWCRSAAIWERVLWHFGESVNPGGFFTRGKTSRGSWYSANPVLLWKDHVWCSTLKVWIPGLETARQRFHIQQMMMESGEGKTEVFLDGLRPCEEYPLDLFFSGQTDPVLMAWIDTMVALMTKHHLEGRLSSSPSPISSRRHL
jgi:hypothetical protein